MTIISWGTDFEPSYNMERANEQGPKGFVYQKPKMEGSLAWILEEWVKFLSAKVDRTK